MAAKTPEMICTHCKKKFDALPFECKFCNLKFCGDHRLPEDHDCVGLKLRKDNLQKRISRGERIIYEPKVKKEIKVKFDEPIETERDFATPLLKSPMAKIGLIVAVIVLIGVLFMIFK